MDIEITLLIEKLNFWSAISAEKIMYLYSIQRSLLFNASKLAFAEAFENFSNICVAYHLCNNIINAERLHF